METILIIVVCAACAAVGILLGRRLGQGKLQTEKAILEEKLRHAESEAKESERRHSAALSEREQMHSKLLSELKDGHKSAIEEKERTFSESLKREKEHHSDALEAMHGRFDETVAKMQAQIEELTSRLLKERQKELSASNTESIDKILSPLKEELEQMRKEIKDNTVKHSELGGQLSENLKQVLHHADSARMSADNLASVMRGNTRTQGEWGETVLAEILRSQGLTEEVHFFTQVVLTDEKGKPCKNEKDKFMRPDAVMKLDNDRMVIIDAKVSLSAYFEYLESETDENRSDALSRHVRSVESHVKELVGKQYHNYSFAGCQSVNYVIMFVPNTSALHAATTAKPSLWRDAMKQGVYIADEQTLYAAMKIISLTWSQIAQSKNHEEIFKSANKILDQVGRFMETYETIGKKLGETQKAYEEAGKKLVDGRQTIPQACNKLLKLGANYEKEPKIANKKLLGIEVEE